MFFAADSLNANVSVVVAGFRLLDTLGYSTFGRAETCAGTGTSAEQEMAIAISYSALERLDIWLFVQARRDVVYLVCLQRKLRKDRLLKMTC